MLLIFKSNTLDVECRLGTWGASKPQQVVHQPDKGGQRIMESRSSLYPARVASAPQQVAHQPYKGYWQNLRKWYISQLRGPANHSHGTPVSGQQNYRNGPSAQQGLSENYGKSINGGHQAISVMH